MRKRRKVIADVAASQPPPQPTTSEPKPSSKPLCFHCLKAPAKEMLIIGQRRLREAFCSVLCAVEFALYTVDMSGKIWFISEQKWLSGKEAVELVEKQQEAKRQLERFNACAAVDAKEEVANG